MHGNAMITYGVVLCVFAGAIQETEQRVLRAPLVLTPAASVVVVPSVTIPSKEEVDRATLFALASEFGFDLTESAKNLTELALSILTRMRTRGGKHIYQSANFSISNFPRAALEKMLPMTCVTVDTPSEKIWRIESLEDLLTLGPSLFEPYGYDCAGITRALKTKSEACIRVVATLLPAMVFRHIKMPRGVDRVHVIMQYVLTDGTGELHLPKNEKRQEISIDPALTVSMRVKVLDNVREMYEAGFNLAPTWHSQLGVAGSSSSSTQPGGAQLSILQKPSRKRKHEVEAVLEESDTEYLVRWMGYRKTWERWRIHGEVGDALETWEPKENLEDTQALEFWQR